jgi:DNA polymerase-3 subunit delta
MVAVKTHQADAFLKALNPALCAALLYGPDAGLVSERASTLAKRLVARDGGELIRLDEADLEQDPDRLVVELQTIAMFGGRRIVRVSAGRKVTADALEELFDQGRTEGFLIVEAGALRPDDALRSLFERLPCAAAVACFPDEERELRKLIRSQLAAFELDLTPAAEKTLIARLGADRAFSRAEVEKLALFALGKGRIDEEDVAAAVGDAAELALDRVVLQAASGHTRAAVIECDRTIAAGVDPQTIIAALQRHFLRLHRVRSALDSGRALEEVVRQLKPPVHFKHKEAFEAQCRTWTAQRLESALARIAEVAKTARLNYALETTLTERLLLDLGALASEATQPALG